jgi:hypothetical protein
MSPSSRHSAAKRRFFLPESSSSHRGKPRSRFIPQVFELEDRCLLSFTPTLVGNPATIRLDQVLATPANLPSKLVTVMNNSNEMVYPILQDANSTIDGTYQQVVRVNLIDGGSGYNNKPGQGPKVDITGGGGSGATAEAVVNGLGQVYALNLLTPGAGYTSVPTVKIAPPPTGPNSRTATASAIISSLKAPTPIVALYDPLDDYNQSFRGYIGEFNPATGKTEFGLQPGHQVTIEVPLVFWDGARLFLASNGGEPFQTATDPGMPLQNSAAWTYKTAASAFLVPPNAPFSANFPDPVTDVANANGRVMWYHDNTPLAKPNDFATDASGQLTEWTIRDPKLPTWAPNMPKSQVLTIFNYDVSYVDNLTLPAGMEITKVPTQTPPGYNGPSIPTASYAVLGTDLTLDQMQDGMAVFTKTDPNQLNFDLGNYFGGKGYDQFYFPSGPGGINFDKLPAGYNLIALSPNAQTASTYDPTKFQLVSGGNYVKVDTLSTGIATKGSNLITGVNAAVIAKLAAGMQYQIVNFPTVGGTTPIFPQGTYITSVSGTTITMSNPALQNGPDQTPNNQTSYAFVGSQYQSTMGGTNGTDAEITGIDPTVGIYLRPGMLVTGPGINSYLTISSVGTDYTSVKLIGGVPAAGSGSGANPYVFTGSNSSYIVSTLVNNWYAWADYYVANVNATAQSSTGNTYGPGPEKGLADPNALTLYGLDPAVVKQLKIGDSVTGPNIPAHPLLAARVGNVGSGYAVNDILTVSGGTFTTAATLKVVGVNAAGGITGIAVVQGGNYSATPTDPVSVSGGNGSGALFLTNFSANTTISAILSATSVQLSNPVVSAMTGGTYSFNPPEPIVRSGDAKPYTLTFKTQDQKDTALAFAATVYDVMSGFSRLSEPTYLSRSALLLDYVIGGNIGTFILQGQVLPTSRLNQLRDGLKSVLRGVANFNDTPEFNPDTGAEQWYPDPAVGTTGAQITPFGGGAATDANFGVYNLNPYVWFIHIKLGMSGYGFSLDDDTANAQDAANSLQLAYGGTRYTAPNVVDAQKLDNPELYTYGAPFGTLQDTGHIDVTSGVAKGYDLTKFTVINGLSLATVAKLKAFDASNGQGALVTGYGMTTGKSRIYYIGPANPDPNTPNGANASYVVLKEPSPAQDGPAGLYTFSGFSTTLDDGTQLSSPVPSISSLSQTSGAPGTEITITGKAFMPGVFAKALGVTFNGIPAEKFTVNSDSSITVTVPPDATSGLIGVRGPAGTGYSGTDFTVTGGAAPTISSFSPPNGSLGTVVTILGTGFTGTTKVSFNGKPAQTFSVIDDKTLSVTVPIGATTGPIKVETPGGSVSSATNFTVNPPNIASFSPPSGTIGTVVTLTGTGFRGATKVSFNGTAASAFKVLSDTSIQATVPVGASTGPITVETSGGTGASTTNFTITAAVAPSITSFAPPSGSVGTVVTLTGTNFTGTTEVSFNGTKATAFTVVDDTTIRATVPTLATTGRITAANSAGTGTSATDFTVVDAIFPTIASFSPESGPVGTPVVLTGSGFTGTSDVSFNGIQASFVVIDDTTINTTVPDGATSGRISVTAAGTGFSPTNFIVDENVPTDIEVVNGSPQSAKINTAFASTLQAVVKDSFGTPLSGVTVTFTAPVSGASGKFANGTITDTEITNSLGVATSTVFTANGVAGGPYAVMASTTGVAETADFQLTNTGALIPMDTIGAFDPSTGAWYLRNSNNAGAPDAGNFKFGGVDWIPVVGDWDGDGITTVGAVDPATMTWYLRNSNTAGTPDYKFQFGAAGWIPVVGDWQHSGHSGIGLFDPTTANWYLRSQLSSGAPSIPVFGYGGVGWTPVTGDWNGDGTTSVGAVNPQNFWYLRDNNNSGVPVVPPFQFGGVGWTPITGDWDGDGNTSVGVVDPSRNWYLRNLNNSGAPEIPVFQYGQPGWGAVAGHWTAVLPQLAAGGAARHPASATSLTTAQLQLEVQGALGRLQAAGVDSALIARLGSIQFTVGQLVRGTLALSTPAANRVVVDASAAGYGWFVDLTPGQDNEFSKVGSTLRADAGSAAAGHMDLLTVLLHELGHFNGWTELDPVANPDDLMALTLGTGTRRLQALDSVFADKAAAISPL